MGFFIYLDKGRKIDLPNSRTCEERIKLCEQIIEKYPEYFEYALPSGKVSGPMNASEKVVQRLRVMGEYIYQSSPATENNVTTAWKKKRNKKKEIPFSTFKRRDDNEH